MYPRLFLSVGGSILVLISVVGYANTYTETGSPWFWLDGTENAVHGALGLAAIGAVHLPGLKTVAAPHLRVLTGLLGAFLLAAALYGFTLPAGSAAHPNAIAGANLENPVDNLMHLVIGLVAITAAWMGPGARELA